MRDTITVLALAVFSGALTFLAILGIAALSALSRLEKRIGAIEERVGGVDEAAREMSEDL